MKNKLIIFDFAGTLVRMRPAQLLICRSLLVQLFQIYKLGIITGGPKTEVINIIKRLEIDKFFPQENIITANDSISRKPNPILILTLKKRLDSHQVIYVGDSTKDYMMAKSANVSFIYIGKKKIGIRQIESIKELSLTFFDTIKA